MKPELSIEVMCKGVIKSRARICPGDTITFMNDDGSRDPLRIEYSVDTKHRGKIVFIPNPGTKV